MAAPVSPPLSGDSLARLDATAQAELVKRGEIEPAELVEAAIRRAEALEPVLGSIAVPLFEEALAAAREPLPEGPFRGVPFLMKDVGATQAGQPYYAGNRALRHAGYRAPRDTYLGARFRAAGLVTIGKSKTPEFGLQSTTQPLAFGPTRNPFDPSRSSGGSSGGACAAVAAGIVPAAHANDGAGSIRIPAAWCGVIGLKPSRGRIPLETTTVGRAHVGFAVARSLRDVAALLDALHGGEPGVLYRLEPPANPYLDALRAPPGRLRVGVLTRAPGGARVHRECKAAVERAAAVLSDLGHRVEPGGPPALFEEDRALRGLMFGPLEYRLCLRSLARMLGRWVRPDDVEPFLWRLADLEGATLRAEDLVEISEDEQGWVVRVASWFSVQGFDLLVTPTVPVPPPRLDALDGKRVEPLALLDRLIPHMAFTEPWNATGHPALSLPLHRTPEGLPVGVQLVARTGREDLLLRVAAQLETHLPWSELPGPEPGSGA
jgi:amidase